MTKPGAPRYTGKTGAQMNAEWRDKINARPLVTRCGFCRWTHVGTASEGRDAYHQHRTERHPEVKPRRIRRSSLNRFVGRDADKSFRDDGVANAAKVAEMHARKGAA